MRKRPFERSIHRQKDNIKTDVNEILFEGVNWIELAQDMVHWWAFLNMVMNLWVT
jgi:hypothetical protein